MFTCRYAHDSNHSTRPELHGLLIAMELCNRFSSTFRRSMVVHKNIYDAVWASQTTTSQLSRDICLSPDHRTYNLETWISHTLLSFNHLSCPAVDGSFSLFRGVRGSCKSQYYWGGVRSVRVGISSSARRGAIEYCSSRSITFVSAPETFAASGLDPKLLQGSSLMVNFHCYLLPLNQSRHSAPWLWDSEVTILHFLNRQVAAERY